MVMWITALIELIWCGQRSRI